ncbi:DUF748 domain-containing protein [Thermaurantiacus sp.]
MRSPWLWGLAGLVLVGLVWGSTHVVPRLVAREAAAWSRTNLGLEPAIGAIRFDPFRLALDIDGFAIPAGSEPMVATGPILLDVDAWSLLRGRLRFDAVRVEAPEVDARIGADGALNLARLVPPPSDEPPPPVLVSSLRVVGGKIRFTDETRGPGARTRLIPVNLEVSNLHTRRDEGGRFRLTGQSEAGETFAWTGTIALAPLASAGGVALMGIDAARAGRFLGAAIPAEVTSGRGNVTLSYRAAWRDDAPALFVTMPRMRWTDVRAAVRPEVLAGDVTAEALELEGLRLDLKRERDGRTRLRLAVEGVTVTAPRVEGTGRAAGERVALRKAEASGFHLVSGNPAIRVDRLLLESLELDLVRERGGAIGLLRLLPAEDRRGDGAPAAVAIGEITLADGRIIFDERSTVRRQRYELAPLELRIGGFSTAGRAPLALEATGQVNGRPLRVSGTVEMPGPRADLIVRLDQLPLALALPYLPDFPALELMSGALSIAGRARAAPDGRGGFDLGFDGTVDVDDFRLRELVRNSDLVRFRQLRMRGIAYDGRGLTIAEGRLISPVGQVALLDDGAFNYGFLLDEGLSVAQAAARLEARRAPRARLRRAERREAAARAAAERQARAAERAARREAPPPELPVTLKRLLIEGGTLAFADFVIEPDFSAEIRAVWGEIANISNRPGAVARIDLKGHVVDRFSPVEIRGTMNPFDYALATNMRLSFRNIDLPVFNPYSGTYAGYAIAKGKLSTELDYRIVNAALDANHKVRIEQLEWGEATESKEKVGLPIRLATAVMKDKAGVIAFELPVSGSVDDPEFRLAPLVWKFLGQFLGKLVTAPFRALGGLFAEKADAQFLDFAAGSAALPPGAAETLAELGKALGEKPDLRLDIPASPGLEADALALAAERLEAALMVRERKANPQAAFAELPAEKQYDRMAALYRAQLKARPEVPEAPRGISREEAQARAIDGMRAQLLAHYRPSAAELEDLGKARAEAVRQALLAPGTVAPERIFVDRNDRFVAKDDHVRMELKLK